MSLDNINQNNDLAMFKNDILLEIKKIEDRMNTKINQLQTSFQDNSTEQKTQFEKITNNITDINALLVTRKMDDEKLSDILNMKQKIDFQLSSARSKISNINKDLQDAINKYDRIILDNLEVPGLIGKNCKYKYLNFFLEDIYKIITNLQLFKEKQIAHTQSYAEKMETLIQNMEFKMKELNETTIKLCDSKFAEAKIDIEKRCKVTEELIQILRIENGKCALDLIKTTENVKIDYEKLENIQNDINLTLESKIKIYKNVVEENTKNYLKMEDDYKLLKQKFTQLAEFIRDIRFQKNILNKKKFFESAALNIDFRKKQQFKDDYDMTTYNKIGDDVISYLQKTENNFNKNNNQNKNIGKRRRSMMFRGEMNEKKSNEKSENKNVDAFMQLIKNSENNSKNYNYTGSIEKKTNSIDAKKKDKYTSSNEISFSLLINNKNSFTSPRFSKAEKQLVINENVSSLNFLSEKRKLTENNLNNMKNNNSKNINTINNTSINLKRISISKENNSAINSNIKVIQEIQKDKMNTIKNIFDYSEKYPNSHNLYKVNKTVGNMKLKTKFLLEEQKENKELSNIMDKENLNSRNIEQKSGKNDLQNHKKNLTNSNTFLLTELKMDKKPNNLNEDLTNKKMKELEKNFMDLTQKINEINKTLSYINKNIENNKMAFNHKLSTNVCKLEASINNIKYIVCKTRMAKSTRKNNDTQDEEVKKVPHDESNILLRKIEPYLIKKFIKNS